MPLISGSKIFPTTWRFYHSHFPKATPRRGFFKTLQKLAASWLTLVFDTWHLPETFQN
jgi:hypothetical protein